MLKTSHTVKSLQEGIDVATEPTQDELVFAKRLEGTPKQFDLASTKLLQSLVRKGLAAEFGKEGYARGHAWDKYVR